VVKEQLEPPQNLLLAAANERHNLVGTQKTVPVDEPDDLAVALSKLHGGNDGRAGETWKSCLHGAIMHDDAKVR
jgi:hypothetical protein